MKLAIISGSQRSGSNTQKVAGIIDKYLVEALKTETFLVDLSLHPLPLWDQTVGKTDSPAHKQWQPLGRELETCEGFVILSPEWHGMVPSALKNFFLYCGTSHAGHKPALIVSVSAGIGGSYPVTELRTSSYKNNRLCYIPEHVILRHVGDFLENYSDPVSEVHKNLKDRLHYCLHLLTTYAGALNTVRNSGVINFRDFANGM